MFGMGWGELAVCALVGFFVFGPERLPNVARDAARTLHRLRTAAQSFTDEIKDGLPDREAMGLGGLGEIKDIRDLHPRRIVSRASCTHAAGFLTLRLFKSEQRACGG